MTFDYTECWNLPNSSSTTSPSYQPIPSSSYSYSLRSSDASLSIPTPSYAYFYNDSAPQNQKHTCFIRFNVVADLDAPVFQYYKLTNFYQNNRRYVQSLDTSQLSGQYVSPGSLSGSNCKPLAVTSDGKAIYPCGLIANSVFNGARLPSSFVPFLASNARTDTISGFRPTSDPSGASDYNFTQSGIAWPGEAKKYSATSGYTSNLSEVVPPPNWALMYPDNYTTENPPPDLTKDEHFQNWMRTAGLPTFSKLYGRNDGEVLKAGEYVVQINYSMCTFRLPPWVRVLMGRAPRLPSPRVQRYQVPRHLDRLVDRREEPLPGVGVRSGCGGVCVVGTGGDGEAFG